VARARTGTNVVAQKGDLIIERDPLRPSGRLLRQGAMEASYIDLADPAHLEFDYLRWMRLILRAARAHRVLHIGGGACALPRALAAEDPSGRQEVCELDAAVLDMARAHLGLRRMPGLRVRQGDGREHVARQPENGWDAIVIDAFRGASVPRHLVTVQAVTDVARVAPLALVNVVDNRSAHVVRGVAAGLGAVYPLTWTVGARVGNTIVVGSRAKLDLDRIRAQAAADPSPARLTSPSVLEGVLAGTPAWQDG
jgi:spermidine synthase